MNLNRTDGAYELDDEYNSLSIVNQAHEEIP